MLRNCVLGVLVLGFSLQVYGQETAAALRAHVEYLASDALEGRGPGTDGKDLATVYIEQQFAQAGLQPFFNDSLVVPFVYGSAMARAKGYNVVGVLEGTDASLRHEYVVLGAHYDHLGYRMVDGEKVIYNGADDNASGTATLIKLAQHYAKPGNRPARSLIFAAFDAEELGLHGSKDFVKRLSEEQKLQIGKMFSFDMVGMLTANDGLSLKGIASLRDGESTAKKIAARSGVNLQNMSKNIEQRTDTAPFGAVGIPAAHFFTGTKSPYHKPEDTAEKLDYAGMERVFDYSTALISELANADVLRRTARMQRLAEGKLVDRWTLGLVANVGSSHHRYPDRFYHAKPAYSYGAGLRTNLKLTKHLALNVEALYHSDASRSEEGTYRRQSITVPASIEIGLNNQAEINLFLGVGAYYRFVQSGSDGDRDLDFDAYDNINDAGLQITLGWEVNRMRFGFESRYGLQSIYTNDVRVRSNEALFTIGYRFF
ncbi:MAG: M28 family peptidase [Weeksellaceae bacterium]|nr:M28 family peptidase [Weeksellaceae bacterium]